MGINEFHAHMIETGSVVKKGESADARMIRYGTGYYPSDVGVEMVILDIEDFRLSGKLAEPRLSVELEELAVNLDCSLASKGSENGRRMLEMQREKDYNANRMVRMDGNSESIDQLNYSKSKSYNGNKSYT